MAVNIIWNNRPPVTPFLGFRELHVNPEPEFPFGRKGLVFVSAWAELGPPNDAVGMLILDGDVAIDPHDNRSMHKAIWHNPNAVHVSAVKLWPVSTLDKQWVWGHGRRGEFTQENVSNPDMFSFSFTFLPAILMEALEPAGAADWTYPQVDLFTWELAQKLEIEVEVVKDCTPKHMHW
jgi:hypothetical protein